MYFSLPTFRERIWVLVVILEPEAISELERAKLSGKDTGKRGSKKCSIG